MKPTVTVTHNFPEAALETLRSRAEVICNDSGTSLSSADLIDRAGRSHALVSYLTDKIDAAVLDAGAGHLKIVANYGAGFNNIDVVHAQKKKIWVSNTPGVLHETTADLTWAMILGVARRIVEADRFTRGGKFRGWQANMFLGGDVYGKTLGVIGCGEIGKAVARRARGFNMRVMYHQRKHLPAPEEKKLNARLVPLEKLLKESDFVTLHVPLTHQTRYIIGENQLAMMKPTAYLIHTARGKVVDDRALVKAQKNNTIAGAALDVFENEPDLTEGMTELDNLIILPHIGSATVATRNTMAKLVVANVFDALAGKRPRTLIPNWPA